jgi:hypothetical protein
MKHRDKFTFLPLPMWSSKMHEFKFSVTLGSEMLEIGWRGFICHRVTNLSDP